jgi:hypothetical protein
MTTTVIRTEPHAKSQEYLQAQKRRVTERAVSVLHKDKKTLKGTEIKTRLLLQVISWLVRSNE